MMLSTNSPLCLTIFATVKSTSGRTNAQTIHTQNHLDSLQDN